MSTHQQKWDASRGAPCEIACKRADQRCNEAFDSAMASNASDNRYNDSMDSIAKGINCVAAVNHANKCLANSAPPQQGIIRPQVFQAPVPQQGIIRPQVFQAPVPQQGIISPQVFQAPVPQPRQYDVRNTPAFNLPQPAFNVPQPAFNVPQPAFNVPQPAFNVPRPAPMQNIIRQNPPQAVQHAPAPINRINPPHVLGRCPPVAPRPCNGNAIQLVEISVQDTREGAINELRKISPQAAADEATIKAIMRPPGAHPKQEFCKIKLFLNM
jgi:hypothetical protein